ncbi:HdeD family acid-resistance protein [Polyangium aurulentum]|uniref:HdeD family acid-resistance protein n=1 Tax=Polyangium aurulentum TaxID=2567896 RepID=UPI0010ADC2BA|nr:HdeD family acid-resistance protein [Polyangium aurulentum]UQA58955.1 HdeD family acid-resistance protein [Polyangium aurulentum]
MANPMTDDLRSNLRGMVHGTAGGLIGLGAVLLALGLVALMLPPLVGLTTAFVLGWLLAVAGVFQVIHSIADRHAPRTGWSIVIGLLRLAAGVLLILYPLAGTVALTAILGGYFLASGLAKTIRSFQHRREVPSWGWMLFDGIISLALGVIIWSSFPRSSMWLIGTLVGVEMMMAGISTLTLGMTLRRAPILGGPTGTARV